MGHEILHNNLYHIEPAGMDDIVGIGEAHLQSWLETYPNDEYGVTEDWIREEFAFLTKEGVGEKGEPNGIEFRKRIIEELDERSLYEVVKDEKGKVQGFLHAHRTPTRASLNAIYLTRELKGKGVAQKLVEHLLDFAGELPIELEVIAYNERAIKFYEKYGFVRGEIEEGWFHGKMPVLKMKRSAKGGES